MRIIRAIIVCLVLGMTVFRSSAVSLLSNRRKSNSKLKSFTERYALPTSVHSIAAKLPLTFGYRFTDDYGTMQSREEKTDPNGSKTGSYSFVDASGIYRRVDYVADRHGFRATVTTNEPGTMALDPADVRMLTENKDMGLGISRHSTGNLPHSTSLFSKYNLSSDFPERNFPASGQSLGIASEVSKSPVFESERTQLETPKFFNSVNTYKGSSVTFSPAVVSLLRDLDDPGPIVYENSQKTSPENFLGEPNDFLYDDKTSSGGYQKKGPTRYPRRHRDSRFRAKKNHVVKIHIPQGYEDHDLPLYRDK